MTDLKSILNLENKSTNFWNYAIYLNFKSQLLPGFRYYEEDGVEKKDKLTRIFSPTIIQLGIGWYYKKNSNSWVNLSPLSARGILVGGSYTQEIYKRVKNILVLKKEKPVY